MPREAVCGPTWPLRPWLGRVTKAQKRADIAAVEAVAPSGTAGTASGSPHFPAEPACGRHRGPRRSSGREVVPAHPAFAAVGVHLPRPGNKIRTPAPKELAITRASDTLALCSTLSNGQVAQLVEQRTENPCVGGSNPPLPIPKCFWGKWLQLLALCGFRRCHAAHQFAPISGTSLELSPVWLAPSNHQQWQGRTCEWF